ncbi:hypothetical protein B7494_g8540 [Chlorociboria aeruginascens]|nr:hypothetical protein B7494_g8540 [Chlorociboria aeruginascens]
MSIPNDGIASSSTGEGAEDAPLLRNETRSEEDTKSSGRHSAKPLSTFILYFMALHFMIAFCEMVLVAPLIKLFEHSLCLSYFNFPVGGVEEEYCKIPEIQQPLARIRGWKSMFDTIPVLLVAIPLGHLGDRYGRRKIMAVSLIGVAASLGEIFVVCAFPRIFPLQLVWLSSIILLCGGGLYSTTAFMWAMASETIPKERRSYAFYYIFSAFYIAELLASFLASITMDISLWLPCGLAMASVITCLILLWIMPDSWVLNHSTNAPENMFANNNVEETSRVSNDSLASGFRAALSDRNVFLATPVFLVGTLRYTTLNVLIQYQSIHFDVKLSKGAIFYTETAIVNIILFLFFIPFLTAHIRVKYSVRPEVIDLVMVRSSVFMLLIGSLSLAFAPSRRVLQLGFGSRVSTLSLVSYWIPDSSKATLYAAIAALENMGHFVGDPSLQMIFAATLRLSNAWHAMPFFVAAILYCLAGFSTVFIKIGRHSRI